MKGKVSFMGSTPCSEARPHEAWQRLKRSEAILVDVREGDEVNVGRVPEAVHIPLGRLEQRSRELPMEMEILLICRSGNRSSVAARALAEKGFRSTNVEGGAQAWVEQGLPFTGRVALGRYRDQPSVASGPRGDHYDPLSGAAPSA